LEYWSDGLSIMNSMHQRISVASVLSYRRSVLGFRFLQYSITPTLHKYVEQSSVIKSPLPGGKPKPGPSPQTNAGSTMGLDSLRIVVSVHGSKFFSSRWTGLKQLAVEPVNGYDGVYFAASIRTFTAGTPSESIFSVPSGPKL